jgi:hypothetical protein
MKEIKPMREKWKGSMTGRERFNNQMHYKTVDRTVNMEFGYWNENFTLWDLFRENNITNNNEADLFFNFDKISGIGGNVFLSPPFEEKVLEERGDILVIMNSEGLLAEVPKDGHDTIPHYLKSSITTPDDWKKVKEERFSRLSKERKVDLEALKKQHSPDRDYPLGVHCGSMIGKIRDMLTLEGLSYATFDYPDMIEDMVETCCLLTEDFLDQVLPHFDFDYASGWEDIACKSGPLITMDLFKNVVVPRYKRINKKLKEHGIDIWYTDCDGDVRPMVPHFLESGINCLFPYEVNGCAHPGELLDKYDGELRIMGGVDKMQLIAGKEATKIYLETLVPYVERGGYIPFCDHRCPPDVDPETYLYYLDLKEKMFGL